MEDILYHYTTTASLLGMLKDCSRENPNLTMWATHCNYLNDNSEFLFGKNLCDKAICEYEEEHDIPQENRLGIYIHDQWVEEFHKWAYLGSSASIDEIDYGYPYLLSFSRARESLPMWGMYAKQGNGVALVFDEYKVCEHHVGYDCLYCRDGETILLKEKIKDKYRTNSSEHKHLVDSNIDRSYAIIRLNEIYRAIGPYIKDKAYEFEHEFRVVATNPKVVTNEFGERNQIQALELTAKDSKDTISFRERDGMIIPYVEQKIAVDCLKGIIVGPTADFGRMKDALIILLKNKGVDISKIDIIKSEVPYRG